MRRYATITGMKKWLLLGGGLLATFVLILGLMITLVGRKGSKKIAANAPIIQGDNDSISLTANGANQNAEPAPTEAPQTSGTFRMIATGDFIAHDAINARAKDAGTNYAPFFQDMIPIFEKAQIRYCMQASNAGGDAFGISGYPTYNAPLQWVGGIASVKCNMVNLASDHSNDKGQAAIDANIAEWKKFPEVIKTGAFSSQAEHDAVVYATISDFKIAFLAYTIPSAKPPANTFGVAMYSQDVAKAQIAAAKQAGAQMIIVGMRWGADYATDPNPQQNAEAQFLADQGVDIVLGNGPHVTQPVARLARAGGGETVVWYSIGNFFHAQLEPETNVNCVAAMDIDTGSKKVSSIGCLPVYNHYEWPAAAEAGGNLLARTNFKVVPADTAAELFKTGYMAKKTTLQAQIDRLKASTNKLTEVKMLTSADFDR